jgi:hypothetical protein
MGTYTFLRVEKPCTNKRRVGMADHELVKDGNVWPALHPYSPTSDRIRTLHLGILRDPLRPALLFFYTMALVFGVFDQSGSHQAICSCFQCLSFAFDTLAFGNAMYCDDRHGLAFCFYGHTLFAFSLVSGWRRQALHPAVHRSNVSQRRGRPG